MEEFATLCRNNVKGGEVGAIDEITVIMNAAKAGLKQICHQYKRGDGMQADALCLDYGYLKDFVWRGDPLVPKLYSKGRVALPSGDNAPVPPICKGDQGNSVSRDLGLRDS